MPDAPVYALFDSHVHLDDARLTAPRLDAELDGARSLGWLGAVIAGYGPEQIATSSQI